MADRDAIIDADRKVLAALVAAGDPLSAAREVKHWAYFSTRVGADLFAEWLVSDGLDHIEIAQEDSRDDMEWRVTYTHRLRPTLDAVAAHTVPAAARAERLGGKYDGWETSVEPDSEVAGELGPAVDETVE